MRFYFTYFKNCKYTQGQFSVGNNMCKSMYLKCLRALTNNGWHNNYNDNRERERERERDDDDWLE